MENGSFSQDQFAEWSKNHVAYLDVSKKRGTGLFSEKGFTGYPTICILDASGAVVARHTDHRNRNVEGFTKTMGRARVYLALSKQAAAGDETAELNLFAKDLELGRHSYARGSLGYQARRAKMPPRLRQSVEAQLSTLQYAELTKALRVRLRAGMDRQVYLQAWEDLNLEFFRANRLPAGYRAASVLRTVMQRATKNKDVDLFAAALTSFKKRFGDDEFYGARCQQYESQLQALRVQAKEVAPRQ